MAFFRASLVCFVVFFFSIRRRHTRCALVTGVQTCALPICSLKKVLDGLPVSLADFFAMELPSQPQVFFAAAELAEIAGGRVSYRQVGRNLQGRALQILHERYAPGADKIGRAACRERVWKSV